MTTVAYKAGVFACDGRIQSEDGTILTDSYNKVRDCGETIVGLAGVVNTFESVWEWAKQGYKEEDRPDGEYEALIYCKRTRKIKVLESEAVGFILLDADSFVAIGSGASGAMMAMQCGKTAKAAVEAVISRNSSSGGIVRTIKIRQ